MKQRKTKRMLSVVVVLLVLLLFPALSASAKGKERLTLSKKTFSGMPGTAVKLKAHTGRNKKADVTWMTNNPEVAVVNKNGKVRIVGHGDAKIKAVTTDGRKAVCKVSGVSYSVGADWIKVETPVGVKKYRRYSQVKCGNIYYPSYGCVTVAVSIAASGLGKNYSPVAIHAGSSSARHSERYALKKMGASTSLYNRASISVTTASKILKNMGIKNKAVYKFKPENAVEDMEAHLQTGKPVIVKVNNRNVNGIRIANAHHAMVLIGIDQEGNGIFIEPMTCVINHAHGTNRYFKMSLKKFVKNHMTPSASSNPGAFVTNLKNAGGYILVG